MVMIILSIIVMIMIIRMEKVKVQNLRPRTWAGDVKFAIVVMIILSIIVMIMIIKVEIVKVQNRRPTPRTRAGDLARVNLVTRPVRQLE